MIFPFFLATFQSWCLSYGWPHVEYTIKEDKNSFKNWIKQIWKASYYYILWINLFTLEFFFKPKITSNRNLGRYNPNILLAVGYHFYKTISGLNCWKDWCCSSNNCLRDVSVIYFSFIFFYIVKTLFKGKLK